MQIIDIPIGSLGDVEIDEAAGIVTIKAKLNLGGQEEDGSVSIPVGPFLQKLADAVTNPVVRWLLQAIVGLLP